MDHLQVVRKRLILMGSQFEIVVVSNNAGEAKHLISKAVFEISRIENLISEFKSTSEVSEVNTFAGIKPVKVSREVFGLFQRAIFFSKITDGAFDISAASISKLWKYDGSMTMLPSRNEVQKSIQKVGYGKILCNDRDCSVFLKDRGMKIGFGSIGKGYAADKAREIMIAENVQAGIINASGDISAWGKQPDGKDWSIAVTNPANPEKVFASFSLNDGSVATSGNYEKFAVIGGKKYSHIINPKTGYPAEGISSVTVFAKNAELANAISTAASVLEVSHGLHIIEQLPGVSGIIVDGTGKVHYSRQIILKKNQSL